MGVIISLTLVTAVVTDLFLMPALLLLFKPLGQEAMAEAREPERGGARQPQEGGAQPLKQLPQDF
jgi:predicted RND superfamily exporter protein